MRLRIAARFRDIDANTLVDAVALDDALVVHGIKAILGLDTSSSDAPRLTWRWQPPNGVVVASCSLGRTTAVVWSEGWSDVEGQFVRRIAGIAGGKERWRRDVPKGFFEKIAGTQSAVALRGPDRRWVVLDRASGHEIVTTRESGDAIASDREAVLFAGADTLVELELRSGLERFRAARSGLVIECAVASQARWFLGGAAEVVAIERASGAIAWRASLPSRDLLPLLGGAGDPVVREAGIGALAVDGDQNAVYASDLNGSLHCLDAATGRLVWSCEGRGYPDAQLGAAAVIVAARDRRYLVFPCADGHVYLVDATSGRIEDALDAAVPLESDARALRTCAAIPISDAVWLVHPV